MDFQFMKKLSRAEIVDGVVIFVMTVFDFI